MKYVKKYESFLNKKTVDYNKIYSMTFDDIVYATGKIIPNPGKGIRDVGCFLVGYDQEGNEKAYVVKNRTWKWIREATPEEIEQYNIYNNIEKYNL